MLLLLLLLLMMMMVVVVMMMMMMMMMMTTALLICDHPGGIGACAVHSIFLILSRAPVNRGLPSIVGADNARWHSTPLGPSSEHDGFSRPPLSGGDWI